jgi:hypothetical protein
MKRFCQFYAVHPRHINIGKTTIHGMLFYQLEGITAVSGSEDDIALATEIRFNDPENRIFIVHNQDGFHGLTGHCCRHAVTPSVEIRAEWAFLSPQRYRRTGEKL